MVNDYLHDVKCVNYGRFGWMSFGEEFWHVGSNGVVDIQRLLGKLHSVVAAVEE